MQREVDMYVRMKETVLQGKANLAGALTAEMVGADGSRIERVETEFLRRVGLPSGLQDAVDGAGVLRGIVTLAEIRRALRPAA